MDKPELATDTRARRRWSVALAALEAQAGTDRVALDSASLYGNEDGAPYWQVVAWNGEDDPPLHVMVDARSGAVLPDH